MALAIALIALVVLGGLAALVTLKGRDADEAVGVLSSETRRLNAFADGWTNKEGHLLQRLFCFSAPIHV